MTEQLLTYLRELRIPVSKAFLERALHAHPDYPSLLSVSDVLERLGIATSIGHIDEQKLMDVGFPYLLFLNHKDRGFTLVRERKDFESISKQVDLTRDVILKAEPANQILDSDNKQAYFREKFSGRITSILIVIVILFLLLISVRYFESSHVALLVTVLAGISVGYVLVAKELGVTYKAVESFCRAGKQTGCDQVLGSDGAKLFNHISLSELVLGYFSAQLFIGMFILPYEGLRTAYLAVLALLSIMSSPIIGYSLYYQAIKAQSWCKLCLVVIGILTAQIFLFVTGVIQAWFAISDVNVLSVAISVILFGGSNLAVILTAERVRSTQESIQGEAKALRLKHAPEVFIHQLKQQRKVDVSLFEKEVLLGNPLAPVRITMASNMFCNPCKAMHQRLSELIDIYPEKVCASIRFLPAGKSNDMTDEFPDPRTYLLSYLTENTQRKENETGLTESVIRDWFDTKNIQDFSQKYPIRFRELDRDDIKEQLALHDNWVQSANITHTPTLFLNGYEMPDTYTVHDLKAMIPGLAESLSKLESRPSQTIKDVGEKYA